MRLRPQQSESTRIAKTDGMAQIYIPAKARPYGVLDMAGKDQGATANADQSDFNKKLVVTTSLILSYPLSPLLTGYFGLINSP